MKALSEFTNLFPLTKTLCFELEPIGKTQENMQINGVIEADENLAESYKEMKKTLDKFHREYIDKALSTVELARLEEYYRLISTPMEQRRNKMFLKEFNEVKMALRKQIAKQFSDDWKEKSKKLLDIEGFKGFTTYFSGYNTNRENLYKADEKAGTIAYRLIDENLPIFINNMRVFEKLKNSKIADSFYEIYSQICQSGDGSLYDMFKLEYYNNLLTQSGITRYNTVIGGIKPEDGKNIKGLNQYINEYNKLHGEKKLPRMKTLRKQILSQVNSTSYIPKAFGSADELLERADSFYNSDLKIKDGDRDGGEQKDVILRLSEVLHSLTAYNTDGIYIRNDDSIALISQRIFGKYSVISDALDRYYDNVIYPGYQDEYRQVKSIKKKEDLENVKKEYIEKSAYHPLGLLQKALDAYFSNNDDEEMRLHYVENCLSDYFAAMKVSDRNGNKYELIPDIESKYKSVEPILNSFGTGRQAFNKEEKDCLKAFLDSLMAFYHFIKPLYIDPDAGFEWDNLFYGEFNPLCEQLKGITRLYDAVRNFATKKPYKTDKLKLVFQCGYFLSGWAQDYTTKKAMIIEKDGDYYVFIIKDTLKEADIAILESSAGCDCKLIVYDFQKPDFKNFPRLFIRSKGEKFSPAIEKYNLPVHEILDIYDNKKFKHEYGKNNPESFRESLTKLIDYFKLGLLSHEDYKHFDYK